MTPAQICSSEESLPLLPLMEWIYGLSAEEPVNYNELRFRLTKILLDAHLLPPDTYEWNSEDL